MNRAEVIKLLETEGWTKADAMRALEGVDFSQHPDELVIRKATSLFAGAELQKRQRLQAAQKTLVTKKTKAIEEKDKVTSHLRSRVEVLASENEELAEVNDLLKKDNKALKNLIDQIKLKIAIDVKNLMRYEDSELRKALAKWFKSSQG